MTKEQRIEAARKRIEELRKLISEWTRRWDTYLMSQEEI